MNASDRIIIQYFFSVAQWGIQGLDYWEIYISEKFPHKERRICFIKVSVKDRNCQRPMSHVKFKMHVDLSLFYNILSW